MPLLDQVGAEQGLSDVQIGYAASKGFARGLKSNVAWHCRLGSCVNLQGSVAQATFAEVSRCILARLLQLFVSVNLQRLQCR